MSKETSYQESTPSVRAEPVRQKLRVPTWEEIAVLDAELRRRAGKPAAKAPRVGTLTEPPKN